MTPLRPVIEHDPFRPDWTCSGCGEPWPCPPARERMLELYRDNYVNLAQYLGGRWLQMVSDFDLADGAEVTRRLLGWIPRRSRSPIGVLSR